MTSPLLPPSPTPHVISEKPNTPFSEAGFCKRRSSFGKFVRNSLIVVTVAVLPVVVCWQDCSSCLLRKCCVCLLFISLFGCLFSWWLLLASACLHFPPAQPRRLTSPLLPPSPTPHVISEKPNTPVSEAGFCNRRSSFGNFVRNVSACCCLLARLLFLFVEEVLCLSVVYLFVWLFVFLVSSVSFRLPPLPSSGRVKARKTHQLPPSCRRTRGDLSLRPAGTVPELLSGTRGCKTLFCPTSFAAISALFSPYVSTPPPPHPL